MVSDADDQADSGTKGAFSMVADGHALLRVCRCSPNSLYMNMHSEK